MPYRHYETTTAAVLLAVNSSFSNTYTKPHLYRITSDVLFHIDMYLPTGATTTSARMEPFTEYYINLDPAQVLSFLKGTGAVDGTIWITRVDRL